MIKFKTRKGYTNMYNDYQIEEICAYLDEINEIMLEMEERANGLLVCPSDEIDICIEEINQYREMTDELFEYIGQICSEDETGMLAKAVCPTTDRVAIRDDVECIFEARQSLNAVFNRILVLNPQIIKRLGKEKEKMLGEIKNNNEGQSAKVSKYYNAINNEADKYHFTQKNRIV